MKVKIKKLTPEAVIPAKKGDSVAFDVTATSEIIVSDEKGTFGYVEYGTGLAFEVPTGYGLFLAPRSSISETGLILANSVGIVDPDYRGEVKFRFKYISRTKKYAVGDRIGQIYILPIPQIEWEETDDLTKTERNDGGFGSTGA